jgi:threonine dehydrogenase-like Zn-dependent dehydrogenase
MRAAIMRNKRLVVDELPVPEPGPGEVLVKTLACGICGSDLHTLTDAEKLVETSRRSGGVFIMDLNRDVVMGHEFCAEVVDHGPDTEKHIAAGRKVCSMPIVLRSSGVQAVGYSNDHPGGYGEYMRLTESLLPEVPDGLPTDYAALTEPMAVGLHAVEKAAIGKDDVPLVIGCGPVGLSVIAALRLKDIRPVVAADFSPLRRSLAETMGADVTVDPAQTSPYQSWREAAACDDPARASEQPPWASGPALRPAVIFECVGVPGVIDQIMELSPQGTRIVVAGVCMEQDRIQPAYGINKELNLQFVLGYTREEFAATLRNIADGKIPVEPLVTGKVGIDGVAQAFDDLGSPDHHAKILVEPWRC